MSIQKPIGWGVSVGLLWLVSASSAVGQQSADQQKCINSLNKGGIGVAKAQGKENVACVKKAGKGQLTGTAQACLTSDPKQKIQQKKDATVASDGANCGTAPGFGYTGAAAVNDAAVQGKLDLTADVFGANLDTAVISCDTNGAGCGCQAKIIKDVEKLAKAKLGEFLKCKKVALKSATSAASLVACVNGAGTAGSIAADTKGKIKKNLDKLNADIGDACNGVTGAFPGGCSAFSGPMLGACLDTKVECRVCQIINEMDGLSVNCDLFDDGVENLSCFSGSNAPTPTPTITPTVTNTPTPTNTFGPGTIFQGALLKTSGLFTYSAMIGIPGADTECNSNFPGSHTCTFAELQAAEAADDLDGAVDINLNPITAFWAIDSTRPQTQQCHTTVAWDYQTAHTGHFADVSALNNGAGTLGPVTTGFCLNQNWVGCCL